MLFGTEWIVESAQASLVRSSVQNGCFVTRERTGGSFASFAKELVLSQVAKPRERTCHAVGPNIKTAPCGGTRCDRNRPQLHVVPVVTGTDHNGVFVSCNVETLSWLAAPWKLFRAEDVEQSAEISQAKMIHYNF